MAKCMDGKENYACDREEGMDSEEIANVSMQIPYSLYGRIQAPITADGGSNEEKMMHKKEKKVITVKNTVSQYKVGRSLSLESYCRHTEIKRTPSLDTAKLSSLNADETTFVKTYLLESFDNLGNHIMHIAAKEGDIGMVKDLLKSGCDPDVINFNGCSPLFLASERGHSPVVKELLSAGTDKELFNDEGMFPIHTACLNGHRNVVRMLIDAGANIEAKDTSGNSPLILSSSHGFPEVCEILIEKGCNLEAVNYDHCTALLEAVSYCCIGVLKQLAKAGANLDAKDGMGQTALTLGSAKGLVWAVDILLRRGASVAEFDIKQNTALHAACDGGNLHVVERLLAFGSDGNAANTNGVTPLHVTAYHGHVNIANALLLYGADVNSSTYDGFTPLTLATKYGHYALVKTLFDAHCDLDIADKRGNTPLHYAAMRGHTKIAKLLVEAGCNTSSLNRKRHTALYYAEEQGNKEVITLLPLASTTMGSTQQFLVAKEHDPLMHMQHKNHRDHLAQDFHSVSKPFLSEACRKDIYDFPNNDNTDKAILGHIEKTKILEDILPFVAEDTTDDTENSSSEQSEEIFSDDLIHTEINISDGTENATPARWKEFLSNPSLVGQSFLQLAMQIGDTEFLKAGPTVEADPMKLIQPLYGAIKDNNIGDTKALLALGAKSDELYKGTTALHQICKKSSVGLLIRVLKQEDINLDVADYKGDTPLHIACRYKSLSALKLLIKSSANINATNAKGYTPAYLAVKYQNHEALTILINAGANINQPTVEGMNPILLACESDQFDLTETLVNKGAEVNVASSTGSTPLHFAVVNKNLKLVKLLLWASADPNTADGSGKTPLHLVIEKQCYEMTKRLLYFGANPNIQNKNGITPLALLEEYGFECFQIFGEAFTQESSIDSLMPIHRAVIMEDEDMIRFLLRRRVDPNVVCKEVPLFFQEFIKEEHLSFSLDFHEIEGQTALHIAVLLKNEDIVTLLLQAGADPNITNKEGRTALHHAAKCEDENLMFQLIMSGTNINATDNKGQTALHITAALGDEDISNLLVRRGANVSIKDSNGQTPKDIALSKGNEDIAIMLKLVKNFDSGVYSPISPLNMAIVNDDEDAVQLCLDRRERIDEGVSPLQLAYLLERKTIYKMLVKGSQTQYFDITDIDISSEDSSEEEENDEEMTDHLPKVKKEPGLKTLRAKLQEYGQTIPHIYDYTTDINALFHELYIELYDGKTDLHLKCSIVPKTHQQSCDFSDLKDEVNEQNVCGHTPLHIAVWSSNTPAIEGLLQLNPLLNVQDCHGLTPMWVSLLKEELEIFEILVAMGADVNVQLCNRYLNLGLWQIEKTAYKYEGIISHSTQPIGLTPLCVAVLEPDMYPYVKILVNAGAYVNTETVKHSPLYIASYTGNETVVQMLIERGADHSWCDEEGATPLYVASERGHDNIVRLLLAAGAERENKFYTGSTPLHAAVLQNRTEAVQVLVRAGSDLKTTTNFNNTPLVSAARQGNLELVKTLIHDYGASLLVHIPGHNNMTPKQWAKKHGHELVAIYLHEIEAGIIRTTIVEAPRALFWYYTEMMKPVMQPSEDTELSTELQKVLGMVSTPGEPVRHHQIWKCQGDQPMLPMLQDKEEEDEYEKMPETKVKIWSKCIGCFMDSPADDIHAVGCDCNIFCKNCFAKASAYPLKCPKHGRVFSPIGHKNCHAILIAGQMGEPEEREVFNMDVINIYNALKDTRIIGLRDHNIIKITDGTRKSVLDALAAVQQEISKAREELPSSLLLYYSGHSTKVDDEFTLHLGESNFVKGRQLKAALSFTEVNQLLVLLDCCYAQSADVLPDATYPDSYQALWASSSCQETSGANYVGSRFSKYVVGAMRSGSQCFLEASANPAGSYTCPFCKAFQDDCQKSSTLSMSRVQRYVFEHVMEESKIAHHFVFDLPKASANEKDVQHQTPHLEEKSPGKRVPLCFAHPRPLAYAVWFVTEMGTSLPIPLSSLEDTIHALRQKLLQEVQSIVPPWLRADHLMITDARTRRCELYDIDKIRCCIREIGSILKVCIRSPEKFTSITANKEGDMTSGLYKSYHSHFQSSLPCVRPLESRNNSLQALNHLAMEYLAESCTDCTSAVVRPREPMYVSTPEEKAIKENQEKTFIIEVQKQALSGLLKAISVQNLKHEVIIKDIKTLLSHLLDIPSDGRRRLLISVKKNYIEYQVNFVMFCV